MKSSIIDKFKRDELEEAAEKSLISAGLEAVFAENLDAELLKSGIQRSKNNVPTKKNFSWTKPRILTSAAAAIVVLVAAVFLFRPSFSSDPNALVQGYLQESAVDFAQNTRSAVEATNEIQQALLAKDYPKVLELARLGVDENSSLSQKERAAFYSGLAHLQMGEYPSASLFFQQTKQFDAGNFQKDATWLLAISLLKENRVEEAKPILTEVASFSNWSKSKDAKELLKSLK